MEGAVESGILRIRGCSASALVRSSDKRARPRTEREGWQWRGMVRYLSRVSRDRIGTFCDCVISRRLSKWNLLEARSTVVGPPTRSLPSWRPSQHPDHKERLLTGRFGTEWAVLYFTTSRPSVPCHTRHPFTLPHKGNSELPPPSLPRKAKDFPADSPALHHLEAPPTPANSLLLFFPSSHLRVTLTQNHTCNPTYLPPLPLRLPLSHNIPLTLFTTPLGASPSYLPNLRFHRQQK